MGVSLRGKDADSGGGFLNEVIVTLKKNIWEVFDYGGAAKPVNALRVDMENPEVEIKPQYFSAGSTDDRTIVNNGKALEPTKANITGLPKNCVALIWFNSLEEAGLPDALMEKATTDISVLDGMVVEVVQIPAKGLDGKVRQRTGKDGKVYEATHTVVSKIVSLPGESGAVDSAAKPSGATSDTAVSDKATALLLDLISKHKSVPKASLAKMAFEELKTDKDRNKILKLFGDDEYLSNGPWKYENGIVG